MTFWLVLKTSLDNFGFEIERHMKFTKHTHTNTSFDPLHNMHIDSKIVKYNSSCFCYISRESYFYL